MGKKDLVRKDRIKEYLDNIEKQMDDIRSIDIPARDFFLDPQNTIYIKAIKYSLSCAIQDVTRICIHIASTMGLWKVRESGTEAILDLSEVGILPKEFAERIKGWPGFRNRIIHDYLPNEFDAERLFDSVQNLDDFKRFSRFIQEWLGGMQISECRVSFPDAPVL